MGVTVDLRHAAWLALTVTILAVSLACTPETPVNTPFPSTIDIARPEPIIGISNCSTVIFCSDCPDINVERIIDGDNFATANARIGLFEVDTPESAESRASLRLPSGSGSLLAAL